MLQEEHGLAAIVRKINELEVRLEAIEKSLPMLGTTESPLLDEALSEIGKHDARPASEREARHIRRRK